MEQRLYILLLVTGFVPLILSVSREYTLIQERENWSNAQIYCQAKHTDLAIIKITDEVVQLQNEAQRQQFSSAGWIGMYNDINSWRWSLQNQPLGTMRQWLAGQPDNKFGNQSCGAISTNGWADIPCADRCPFVCFKQSTTGNDSYIYIREKMSWSAAQAHCRTYHTDLASARTTSENSVIAGLIFGYTWFGLFRDSWKWTDQTNSSTISWMSGQPDNALKNENCAYLNNSQVADARCSDIMPFFCYSVIKQRQILKVKVRSSQDVNDPALKAFMLEQIKQELKDHEMDEDVIVKWSEQPDGKVFNKEEQPQINKTATLRRVF